MNYHQHKAGGFEFHRLDLTPQLDAVDKAATQIV
jgi:hypothetical protein